MLPIMEQLYFGPSFNSRAVGRAYLFARFPKSLPVYCYAHFLRFPHRFLFKDEIVLGISFSNMVTLWTLNGEEVQVSGHACVLFVFCEASQFYGKFYDEETSTVLSNIVVPPS